MNAELNRLKQKIKTRDEEIDRLKVLLNREKATSKELRGENIRLIHEIHVMKKAVQAE